MTIIPETCWISTFSNKHNLIIFSEDDIKAFNRDSLELVWEFCDIVEATVLCLDKEEDFLWIATTVNLIYQIDMHSGKCIQVFHLDLDIEVSTYGVDAMNLSANGRILYFTVSAPRKVIFMSYNIEDKSKEIFYTYVIDDSNPFIYYNQDKVTLVNYLWNNLICKNNLFKRIKRLSCHLNDNTSFLVEFLYLNPLWRPIIYRPICLSSNGRFLLCATRGGEYNRFMVLDLKLRKRVEGDNIPYGSEPVYDSKREVFFLVRMKEIISVQIKENKVVARIIFKSEKNEFEKLSLMEDEIMVIAEEKSYILNIDEALKNSEEIVVKKSRLKFWKSKNNR